MHTNISPEQVERMLSHLASLRLHRNRADLETLEALRPAWIGLDAWDMVLDDVTAQRFRDRVGGSRLRLVSG